MNNKQLDENGVPFKIETSVYYATDGDKILIDEDSIRDEFEEQLTELLNNY